MFGDKCQQFLREILFLQKQGTKVLLELARSWIFLLSFFFFTTEVSMYKKFSLLLSFFQSLYCLPLTFLGAAHMYDKLFEKQSSSSK